MPATRIGTLGICQESSTLSSTGSQPCPPLSSLLLPRFQLQSSRLPFINFPLIWHQTLFQAACRPLLMNFLACIFCRVFHVILRSQRPLRRRSWSNFDPGTPPRRPGALGNCSRDQNANTAPFRWTMTGLSKPSISQNPSLAKKIVSRTPSRGLPARKLSTLSNRNRLLM
jgi:hypothetical protein